MINVVNVVEVETLVRQYQEGNKAVFDNLYNKMLKQAIAVRKWLRSHSPASICDADLQALYDDSLLTAVETFSTERGTMFKTWFNVITKRKHANMLTAMNSKKRKSSQIEISLYAIVAEDAMTVIDFCEDCSASEHLELVALNETIKDAFNAFSNSSKQNKKYAQLLVLDSMEFSSKEDKVKTIQRMLNCNSNYSAICRRVRSAKKAFKLFYTEWESQA